MTHTEIELRIGQEFDLLVNGQLVRVKALDRRGRNATLGFRVLGPSRGQEAVRRVPICRAELRKESASE